jgi:hypothetical protein
MYGRAKFDLLGHHILSCEKDSQNAKAGGDHKQAREHAKKLRAVVNTSNFEHTISWISEAV